jgi:CrcB protein
MNAWVLVLLGGAIGAPARYLTDRLISSWHTHDWPWGTFVVNVLGAFALGALVTSAPGTDGLAFLGVGVLGSYTTWSTFSVEVVRLGQQGERRNAITYLMATVVLGVAAAYGGYLLFRP